MALSSSKVVVIGVTTFKRPVLLRQSLDAIAKLNTNTSISVTVVIADNDVSDQHGLEVVAELVKVGYPFPVMAFVVHGKGFTFGRNAILEEAFGRRNADFCAMTDDDQIADPDWLIQMLEMHEKTGADIVGPAVIPHFESPPPAWARSCKTYKRDDKTSGTVKILTGDGGVLFAKSATQLMPFPWYDNDLAMTGGADTLVFENLKTAGATFARVATAKIEEFYPNSRITIGWALRRAYRLGNTSILIALKTKAKSKVWQREVTLIIAAIALFPILMLTTLGRRGKAVDVLCKFARALGKISALAGNGYEEYRTIHGN
jgi:succinoglycan biosynthesis protein ExoM